MIEMASLSLLELLVLVRMLTAGQKGEAGSKIKKDLEPLLAHQCMRLTVSERVDGAITSLQSLRLLSVLPGKTRKATFEAVLDCRWTASSSRILGCRTTPAEDDLDLTQKDLPTSPGIGITCINGCSVQDFLLRPGFSGCAAESASMVSPLPKYQGWMRLQMR